MLQYYLNSTSISIELAILSGGVTVTGRTPFAKVRRQSDNAYFDFNDRIFGGVLTSATAPLTSAIAGIYRTAWDVSGLFTTTTHLVFEYFDASAIDMDEVIFTRSPLSTADIPMGGSVGSVTVKGGWDRDEKDDLFDKLKEINNNLSDFRRKAMILLRDIVDKKFLKKEDLDFLILFKEKGDFMWQEFLKIMKFNNDATTKEVLQKLEEYNSLEESAKKELLVVLNTRLNKETIEEDEE